MGEVVYLKSDSADLICLCPKWLCSTLCGYLLSRYSTVQYSTVQYSTVQYSTITGLTSREFRGVSRPTGSYSLPDFQLALPEYDARDTINVLEALGICIQVHLSL